MGKDRELLHDILVEILGSDNVYYSPPDDMEMNYPCIIYQLSLLGSGFADNTRYIKRNQYQVTIIDEDPDSKIAERVLDLPSAYFDTFYPSNNLNHWQLSLYF